MSTLFKTLFITLIAATLVSCTSTTKKGAVGADRRQLLLVSEAEVADMARTAYATVLTDAKEAGTLNTNTRQLERVRSIAAKLIPQIKVFRADALKAKATRAFVDKAPRKNERPSDHTPVIFEAAL